MRNVLLVDHSGRGHAFADLFVRTNPDVTVHYAPGCGAIDEDRIVPVPGLTLADAAPMVAYAKEIEPDLVFVANANALADGFVDAFTASGLRTVGPDRVAARLESSKIFTKRLCARHRIPSAPFRWFDDPERAAGHVRAVGAPIVVKADGLCGGNGAFVCETVDEALAAIDRLMVAREFGASGDRIVVEEKLVGTELLYFALVSGNDHLMLPMAADYQRSDDGNRGVLSGGMGSFGPHPADTPEGTERFERQILRPLLRAIRSEGIRYRGVIYVGCMLVGDRLHLLEINVRMGEPEAEVILPRIATDFTKVCAAAVDGELGRLPPLEVSDEHLVNVVATQGPTEGYPGWPYGAHGKHYPITGVADADSGHCRVFLGQASTLPDQGLVTDGGRCLHVVGRGSSRQEAARHAYEGMAKIHFEGIRYRTDIGIVMPWEEVAAR
jgi:phosphoribosylamine--glycine ligase